MANNRTKSNSRGPKLNPYAEILKDDEFLNQMDYNSRK